MGKIAKHCYISYKNKEMAELAVEARSIEVNGRSLTVGWADSVKVDHFKTLT